MQITHGIKSEVDSQHNMLDGMVRLSYCCLHHALMHEMGIAAPHNYTFIFAGMRGVRGEG